MEEKSIIVKMHRVILGLLDPNQIVDHINGDGLDNRKSNLKIGTIADNNRNKRNVKKSSKYTGVYKNNNRWSAIIQICNVRIIIGYYDTEIEAKKSYNNILANQKQFVINKLEEIKSKF